MPLNESSRKGPRERWPLEFDLTGVPRDTATRKSLLEEKRISEASEFQREEESMSPVQTVRNSFTVDQPSTEAAITDINNPPHKNYNPSDPKNEFPKMLYHHASGRVLIVKNEKEQKAALKRDFELKPSLDHDYSKVSRAGIAAPANHGEKREEEMTGEELAQLDEEEEAS